MEKTSVTKKIIDDRIKAAREEGAMSVLHWLLGILPEHDRYYGMLIKRVNEIIDSQVIDGIKSDEQTPEKVPMETPDPEPLKKSED